MHAAEGPLMRQWQDTNPAGAYPGIMYVQGSAEPRITPDEPSPSRGGR